MGTFAGVLYSTTCLPSPLVSHLGTVAGELYKSLIIGRVAPDVALFNCLGIFLDQSVGTRELDIGLFIFFSLVRLH